MSFFLQHLRRRFDYDEWANRSTLSAMRAITTSPAITTPPATTTPPAIAVTRFAHIIGTAYLWFCRIEAKTPPCAVWPAWDLDTCEAELVSLQPLRATHVDDADEESLNARVEYTNSKGEPWTSTAGDILEHLLLHAAYHRGQIASDLRQAGHEPPYTDFIQAARTGAIDTL